MVSSSLQIFVIQVYNVSKSVSIIFEGEKGIHIIYKKRVLRLLQLSLLLALNDNHIDNKLCKKMYRGPTTLLP